MTVAGNNPLLRELIVAVWAVNIAIVGRDVVSAMGFAKGGAAPAAPREQGLWGLGAD